jgi:hypothetical protein
VFATPEKLRRTCLFPGGRSEAASVSDAASSAALRRRAALRRASSRLRKILSGQSSHGSWPPACRGQRVWS